MSLATNSPFSAAAAPGHSTAAKCAACTSTRLPASLTRYLTMPLNNLDQRRFPLQPRSHPCFRAPGLGCILINEVIAMKRRRFLSHAIKNASAAVCSQLVPPAFPASFFPQTPAPKTSSNNSARPQLALTLDDPTLTLGSILRWQEANSRILKAVSEKGVRAAMFVCGMRVDEADGAKLLSAWDQAGHLICNHSYSHKLYGEQTSYADFAVDFLTNEKVIAPYRNRTTLFRYPFLKEGDTADKRDRFRALLKERGYRVGHVTIDASDWYVSQRFVDRLSKQPKAPIAPYRDYLVAHLLDRAAFYRHLPPDLFGPPIRPTLLIRFHPLHAFTPP